MVDSALSNSAIPEGAARKRRGLWKTLVPLLLVMVLGVGGKLASLDALRDVQALGEIEAQLSRVEVAALHLALAVRREDTSGTQHQAAVLARQVAALDPPAVAAWFPGDALIAASLARLAADGAPERLAALAARGAVAETDTFVLVAASTADAVHAAIATRTGALWLRVWALGGGALAGLLLTAIGGSTIAAYALARVHRFVQRLEDYARRLRQADADRATAVAEAELAAVARTEALMAETVARLEDARRLAEAARAEAETGQAVAAAALDDTRRAGAATKSMLKALGAALDAPLGQFRALSPVLQVGHTITAADRAALDDIERASERLNRVADGVLDLIRLDTGRATLQTQAFRPELLLERLRATLTDTARRRGLTFRVGVAPDCLESCVGDGARVEALLSVLASHAVDHAPQGTVTLTQTGGGLGFLLTARGLPTADLDAAADADPGLGYAREMARRMGGALSLQADADHGTALHLKLPVAPIAA